MNEVGAVRYNFERGLPNDYAFQDRLQRIRRFKYEKPMMTDGQHMLHDAKIFGELIIMKLMHLNKVSHVSLF